MSERLDSGILCDDAGAHDGVLVHLHHGIDERRRTAGVADAEAGHGISLRETVQEDGALGHARQRGDGHVFSLEGQLRIDLVGENQ